MSFSPEVWEVLLQNPVCLSTLWERDPLRKHGKIALNRAIENLEKDSTENLHKQAMD